MFVVILRNIFQKYQFCSYFTKLHTLKVLCKFGYRITEKFSPTFTEIFILKYQKRGFNHQYVIYKILIFG